MAKGISLEEFKSKLDTDAQSRCLNQEKTVKELYKQKEKLIELLKDKEVEITQLQNRCRTLSNGALCIFCGSKNTCKAKNGIVT